MLYSSTFEDPLEKMKISKLYQRKCNSVTVVTEIPKVKINLIQIVKVLFRKEKQITSQKITDRKLNFRVKII